MAPLWILSTGALGHGLATALEKMHIATHLAPAFQTLACDMSAPGYRALLTQCTDAEALVCTSAMAARLFASLTQQVPAAQARRIWSVPRLIAIGAATQQALVAAAGDAGFTPAVSVPRQARSEALLAMLTQLPARARITVLAPYKGREFLITQLRQQGHRPVVIKLYRRVPRLWQAEQLLQMHTVFLSSGDTARQLARQRQTLADTPTPKCLVPSTRIGNICRALGFAHVCVAQPACAGYAALAASLVPYLTG